MQVKIQRLHPDAVIPTYTKPGDAGLDLVSVSEPTYRSIIDANNKSYFTDYLEYKVGLAIEIPEGYVGLIFPRSSISNTSLSLSNAVGVIDSSYRGEIAFRFRVLNDTPIKYKKGDRIGQLIIIPYPKIELIDSTSLNDTERGIGGFGSTGT